VAVPATTTVRAIVPIRPGRPTLPIPRRNIAGSSLGSVDRRQLVAVSGSARSTISCGIRSPATMRPPVSRIACATRAAQRCSQTISAAELFGLPG
jgi:hypothetical protein